MTEHTGPIYEVTLRVDASVDREIDDWLGEHVAEMLTQPGFLGAEISTVADDDGPGRVVRYFVDSDRSLDEYFAGAAAGMRTATEERFGAAVAASRRVLYPAADDRTRAGSETCLNCQAPLTGQYCGQCGQRAQSRLISVFELLRDAFGDVVDIDSRLWRTLIPLAVRPGLLTKDYLQGRRARYMPPFRTYLVLSLLFFVVAFFDPREELGILFEPEAAQATSENGQDATAALEEAERRRAEAERVRQEALAELEERGIRPTEGDAGSPGFNLTIDGEESDCNLEDYDPAELPPWLGRRLTRERLQVACERMSDEEGAGLRGFLDKLLDYVPVGLFVLLPLMAFVLNMLYPLSKRYYVEHLLFVVHYHAFVFLALTVQTLLTRAAGGLGLDGLAAGAVLAPIPIYIPVYLFRSMRRVYEQGRFVTLLKWSLLLLAYLFGLAVILATVAIFAAFSV